MSGASRSVTPTSANGDTDAASILARLDERSEVTLRILRSLEMRVVTAGLPNWNRSNSVGGSDPFGPPGGMASTLSPEDFAAEEAHFRSQTDPVEAAEATESPAQGSPAMAELDLTSVQTRHADPNPPATARTPSPQGARETGDGAAASGPGSPLSPSREDELLARVAAAESAADALTADKEALWDQLEAVEEQRRSADADATRLRSRVDELLTALGQAEERFREQQRAHAIVVADAVSRHADDALDEAELGSRGALSRSPSMSLVDHNLGATPSEFNDTIRSAAGGSPAPSALNIVGGASQGEQSKFGFKLRYPNLPKRGGRRQGGAALGAAGSPSSPHGTAVRKVGVAGAARQRGLSNTSFPQSPLTSAPSSQARDDAAAHDVSLAV